MLPVLRDVLAAYKTTAYRGDPDDLVWSEELLAGTPAANCFLTRLAAQLADLPKHEQTLDRIRALGRHAQRLAIRVARGSALYSGLNSKIANDTLRALRDAGIVEQDAPRSWRIPDPLLRNFLLELDPSG